MVSLSLDTLTLAGVGCAGTIALACAWRARGPRRARPLPPYPEPRTPVALEPQFPLSPLELEASPVIPSDTRIAARASTAVAPALAELSEGVHFAKLTIPEMVEPRHLVVVGTQPAGRAFAFTTLLDCLRDRGDVALVLDEEGEFLARYFESNVDFVYHPRDRRHVGRQAGFSLAGFFRDARDSFLFVTYWQDELANRAAALTQLVEEAAAAAAELSPTGRRVWLVVPDVQMLGPLPVLGNLLHIQLPPDVRIALGVRQAPALASTCGEMVASGAFSEQRNLLVLQCDDEPTRLRLAALLQTGLGCEEAAAGLEQLRQGQAVLQVAGAPSAAAFQLPMPPRYDDAAPPFEAMQA